MKIVVCGSRTWEDKIALDKILDQLILSVYGAPGFTVIHGGAKGADELAGEWARSRGLREEIHLPDYDRWKKAAPFVRNDTMLDLKPDMVIAFSRNNSPGTQHMIKGALARRLDLVVIHA